VCLASWGMAGAGGDGGMCSRIRLRVPPAREPTAGVGLSARAIICSGAGRVLRLHGGCAGGEPRHAWDQTPEEVQLYVFHDGIGEAWHEDDGTCALAISNSSVAFSFREQGGARWCLDLVLYAEIDPAASYYKVRKDRVSIKLRKGSKGAVWPTLRRVDVMTMDQFPTLPESFRTPKDAPPRAAVLPLPLAQNAPPDTGGQGGGPEWEKLGDSDKVSIMAAERKTLEKLLEAAKMGEVAELKAQVDAIAALNKLDTRQVLNGYLDGNKRGVAHMAASTGQREVLLWAHNAGADFAQCDVHGQSPFFIAAANGHVRSVEAIAALAPEDVDLHDLSSNATALHHAAGNGNAAMVELLLDFGADINANSHLGPAIQWASMSDHRGIVLLLVGRGADPNVCAQRTPGVDRNLPPPLVMSAAMMQTDLCQVYLDKGADVNATDEEGYTALHHACDTGNIPLISLLLEEAVDVLACTATGQTALALARVRWQGTGTLQRISDLLLPAMELAGGTNALLGAGEWVVSCVCVCGWVGEWVSECMLVCLCGV